MHRLVYMKLKAKAQQDSSNRSPTKPSSSSAPAAHHHQASPNRLPVLELSLPDSKSFRASVILPDLSRRFTLLRTNGELLPINNFRQRLRHELETGHITQEDESILMNQYRQQYLNESPSAVHLDYSSPTEHHPAYSPKKPPSTTINALFSANTSARDAAYIRKTLKMSHKTSAVNKPKPEHKEPSPTAQTTVMIPDNPPEDSTPKNSTIPLDYHTTIYSSHHGHPDHLDQMDEWEVEEEVELTPTQFHRLSLAVDRILDSHLSSKIPGSAESQSDSVDQHASLAVASPLDAEFRVHEELFRALPDNSSSSSSPPTSSFSLSINQPNSSLDTPSSPDKNQFPDAQPHPSQELHSMALSINSATSSDDTLNSELYQENLELILPEDGFEEDSSVLQFASELDDLPQPSPFLDREQILPFIDLTYDEVLFIHQTLVSPSPHHQPSKQYGSKAKKSALRVDMSSPTPSHSRGTSHPRNLSTSPSLSSLADPHSSLGSQDPMPPILSPRSSALHQRLNLAKSAGIGTCHKMRTLRQQSHETHSPVEASPIANHNHFPLLTSPSVSDSPDVSSFPLTPPTHHYARFPGAEHPCIPSPPISADLPATSDSKEVRPRNFNSRAGRPIPTTILFRDVEAQAVAANAALYKTESEGKKVPSRKRMISRAQIGAPKLLSASAEITGIQLEPTGSEGRQSFTQKTKALSKGTFRIRLKKKRPSESAINRHETGVSVDEPRTPMKSFGSNPNLREGTWMAESLKGGLFHARESFTDSPSNQLSRSECHRDQVSSPTSWKNPHALTSLRKLMDRHRNSLSHSGQPSKVDGDPKSPVPSTGTSSGDLVPSSEKASSPSRPRRSRTASHSDQDSQNGWKSFSKSLSQLSKSRESGIEEDQSIPIQPLKPHHHQPDKRRPQSPKPWFVVDHTKPDRPQCPEETVAKTASCSSVDVEPEDLTPAIEETCDVSLNITGPVEEPASSGEPMMVRRNSSIEASGVDGEANRGGSKWLEVQTTEPYEGRSDYASSILDLYGCDPNSPGPTSPSQDRSGRSSLSRYSTTFEEPSSSRPASPISSNPGLLLSHPIEPTTSATSTTGSDRPSSLKANDDDHHHHQQQQQHSENELMDLVQQLQSSTRFSKFDPTPNSLLDLALDPHSPQAFLDQNLPKVPLSLSSTNTTTGSHTGSHTAAASHVLSTLKPSLSSSFDQHLRATGPVREDLDGFVDDVDDEAQVWKQILDG